MKYILAFVVLLIGAGSAFAQCPNPINSQPNFPSPGGNVFGATSAQWKSYFGAKSDAVNGTLCAPNIKNLLPPIANGDAANKLYVDDVLLHYLGLIIHEPVTLATPSALPINTYSNGASGVGATLRGSSAGQLTVDGVIPTVGMRILVDHEAFAQNDGVYTVTDPGTVSSFYVLTRASDFDQTADILTNSFFLVVAGQTQSGLGYVLITPPPIVVGTTPLSLVIFAGPLGGGGLGLIPPPTATTLGGVYAYTAPFGYYINGLSTTGNLTALPLPPLPPPTSSMLGGAYSFTAPSGYYINSLSTTGNLTALPLPPPVSPTNLTALTPNILLTPPTITGTGTIGTTAYINTQSGSSYTIGSADAVNHNDAGVEVDMASTTGATTVSIPAAGSTGFTRSYATTVCTLSQPTIITPVSGTINGQGALPLGRYACADIRSDGSAYLAPISVSAGGIADVLQFGADPTGAADSTTAFQSALNVCRDVFIPRGTYKITGTLHICSGGKQLIYGVGGGTVLMPTGGDPNWDSGCFSGSSTPLGAMLVNFNCNGTAYLDSNIVVRDITIDATNMTGPDVAGRLMIMFRNTVSTTVDGVRCVGGNYGDCTAMLRTIDATVQNGYAFAPLNAGFDAWDSDADYHLLDSFVDCNSAGTYGVLLNSSDSNTPAADGHAVYITMSDININNCVVGLYIDPLTTNGSIANVELSNFQFKDSSFTIADMAIKGQVQDLVASHIISSGLNSTSSIYVIQGTSPGIDTGTPVNIAFNTVSFNNDAASDSMILFGAGVHGASVNGFNCLNCTGGYDVHFTENDGLAIGNFPILGAGNILLPAGSSTKGSPTVINSAPAAVSLGACIGGNLITADPKSGALSISGGDTSCVVNFPTNYWTQFPRCTVSSSVAAAVGLTATGSTFTLQPVSGNLPNGEYVWQCVQ